MERLLQKLSFLMNTYPSFKTACLSSLMVVFFYIIKLVVHSNINKRMESKALKIISKKKSSQYITYLLFISLFLLWFSHLQVFFVSLLAVAAAIVVALKELIMCFTGGLLIRISKVFKVGHRIQVDGMRGFVIEKNLFTTKILELGPEKNSQQTTGDIITLPNSLMLSKSFKNESYFKGHSIKSFVFKVKDPKLVSMFEKELLNKAKLLCKDYLLEAKDGISNFCEKEGIHIPSVEPRTKILIEDYEDVTVLVKLPVENSKIADIEQDLNRFYLEWKLKEL